MSEGLDRMGAPWSWYVARNTELMLDLDGTAPGASSLGPTRIRLEAARAILDPEAAYIYRSGTRGHFHVVLVLREPMEAAERFVWEMQLRGDLYRGRCNIMRSLRFHPSPALLIAPRDWTGFYRAPDDRCVCPGKHDFQTFVKCPAAVRLRGEFRSWSPFGQLKPGRKVEALHCEEGELDLDTFARSIDVDTDD